MTTWTPDISSRSGPRYIAIAEAIAEAVTTGELAPGDRLPTHRDLADRLGVTVGTITRAYAEAIRRDLVSGEVGRGTFVKPSLMTFTPLSTRHDSEPDVFDFAVNLPAEGIATERLRDTLPVLTAHPHLGTLLGYPSDTDLDRAKRILASWAETQGAPNAPDRLIINNGAQNGMLAALLTLCRAGDTVLCDEFTYPGMKNLARLLGVRLQGLAMDDHGMTAEALEHAVLHHAPRAVYIVPNYQNPTGTVWPRDRRETLARLANRHGIWIIEDDVYGFLAEDFERLPPLAALAPERTIYLNSAAKCMAPGLRVGYMIGPVELLPALSAGVRLSTMTPAPLTLEVATRWIEDGTAVDSCRWHRAEARARRNLALKALDGFAVAGDTGTYHLWLTLPEPWRSDEFTRAARNRGIIVSAADHFVLGRRAAPPAVRLGLGGGKSRAKVEDGLNRLAEMLRGGPIGSFSSIF
ncbi:PLP-dependent aminotransferase family protein [Oleispirillum naphthae]|uniref:aminotransferase-like domain-containing protein n=1 Tax=Oleispirillum naphthae TaxID=2838853 RepID=UPI003082457C